MYYIPLLQHFCLCVYFSGEKHAQHLLNQDEDVQV
jgi:hypothetical protein